MLSTIWLGEHAYTYVRINAKRSKLIKRAEYERLLKMNVNEIAKFLQDTDYKKEIDELTLKGIERYELGLNKGMARSFKQLLEYSEENLRIIINGYLKRYDIHNFKTILRGMFTKTNKSIIQSALIHAGELTEEYYNSLLEMSSVEEICTSILAVLTELDKEKFNEAIEHFRKNKQIFEIEHALDEYYYMSLLTLAKRLPRSLRAFREYLLLEIDTLNIKTIIRLKREEITDIERYIFKYGAKLDKKTVATLTDLESASDIITHLQTLGYTKDLKADASAIEVENYLRVYLLRKINHILHQQPMSVDIIIGYMLAKELEVRNLNVLLKGKQFKLSDAIIERELVMI